MAAETMKASESVEALVVEKVKFDALIERLAGLSGDHFGASPDDQCWPTVGSIQHANAKLAELTEFLNA